MDWLLTVLNLVVFSDIKDGTSERESLMRIVIACDLDHLPHGPVELDLFSRPLYPSLVYSWYTKK